MSITGRSATVADGDGIDAAVRILQAGGLVAFPTETVYGLGADAAEPAAVRRIFAAKGRPADHPLIVHVASVDQVTRWASTVPDAFWGLAGAFWPGPLTLLLARRPEVDATVAGGLDTIALRVPAHPVALELLTRFGGGLAAPSANRFGKVSPTTAEHVLADLGSDVDLVLDGGACEVGVESTILDLTADPPSILRPGAIDRAAIEACIGPVAVPDAGEASRAPGMLASHYAPKARLELLDDTEAAARRVEALVANGVRVELLDPGSDLERYAHDLYERLRAADRRGAEVVVAVPPAGEGLALAIRDRLTKAAAPRFSGRARPAG